MAQGGCCRVAVEAILVRMIDVRKGNVLAEIAGEESFIKRERRRGKERVSHRKHCIKMFRIPSGGPAWAPDLAFQAFIGARAPGWRSILASCGASRTSSGQTGTSDTGAVTGMYR